MTFPSSSSNSPPDFANLEAIYESLQNFERLKKSTPLRQEADAKLSSFVSGILKKFTANRGILVESSGSSKEYREHLAKIGASLRRLNPDIFNKNNGTNFFKDILTEARNIAEVKALPPRFEVSEANESKNKLDFTQFQTRDKPFDPMLFEPYKEKFQAATRLLPSLQAKTLGRVREDENLSCGTALMAEYMNKEGANLIPSYTYIIQILKNMQPPQTALAVQLERAHTHVLALDFPRAVIKYAAFFLPATILTAYTPPLGITIAGALEIERRRAIAPARAIENEIRHLKLGESITIDTYILLDIEEYMFSSHACLLTITLSRKNPANRNMYSLVLHNTGEGIDYHHSFTDINGSTQYQTALEIEDVTEESLLSSKFMEKLLLLRHLFGQGAKIGKTSNSTIDQLYALLFSLNGTRMPPSKNPRLWQRQQLGGSCALSRFRSLLRSQLSEQNYKQFMDISRYEFILETYSKIKKHQGDIAKQRHICLEVLGKVERRYKKYHAEPPIELKNIKDELLALKIKPLLGRPGRSTWKSLSNILKTNPLVLPQSTLDKTPNSPVIENPIENLIKGYDILIDAQLDPRSIPEAMVFLDKYTINSKTSLPDYQKLLDLASNVAELKAYPLNRNQLYVLAGLSFYIYTALNQAQQHLSSDDFQKMLKNKKMNAAYQTFSEVYYRVNREFKDLLLKRPRETYHPSDNPKHEFWQSLFYVVIQVCQNSLFPIPKKRK